MADKYTKGTLDDHTHIKFYYSNHTMIVNEFTYKHVYPYAKDGAIKIEYLKKIDHDNTRTEPGIN